ncbi:helix-turn-helix domain-containing protein [Chryseobacterium schmidteae]|uniref:helix-turn-helix domain-containing protein n=1 Tax=Chryseobacterium schmidteae TaxID=2730404 RepID=UPI001E484893|nr:helix-turn-helix domain-containing protein [Chryseobacterium schmidteae]
MLYRKVFLYFFYLSLFFSSGKIHGQHSFEDIRSTYDKKKENDITALKGINRYIQKAKLENNLVEQIQGYRDATFYSKDKRLKINYADSAIVTAQRADDKELISTVYLLKGSLYYFYYKNYQSALAEYLKAYQYSKDSKDDYLKYKIVYQMGLVKSYLGYYSEGIEHFNECISYFEPKSKEKLESGATRNVERGYLNSLHQIAVCYRNIKDYKKADSIIDAGLRFSKIDEFSSEKAYLTKCKGISEYHDKNYNSAIILLQKSLPILNKNDDFYWSSVSEFYIGKSYLGLGKEDLAIKQFEKVDSIFQKRQFIVPELFENYNFLIKYYQNRKDSEKELEYSKKLLKADSILNRDFKYLSEKIHKDYDKQILEESKTKLETRNNWGFGTILILFSILAIVALLAWKYYKNGKQIKLKYLELEDKLKQQNKPTSLLYENISSYGKSVLSEDVFVDLQNKLKEFETSEGFKENGLTIDRLANIFHTNKSYLSQYINDVKGINFSKYLSTLRINYITRLMYEDPYYLQLKVQGLADECGIGSRQNFSDLFQEINGIRPTDFIKQRKKELEEQGDISITSYES